MKIKSTLITGLTIAFIFSSCKKEAGPSGPAGADGKNGNANIYSIIFTDPITSGYLFYDTLPGINYSMIDTSLVLAYIKDYGCGSNWYTAPGIGCNGSYSSRVFTGALSGNLTSIILELRKVDGSSDPSIAENISKLKVIVAPASSVISGKKEPVDFSDYYATCRYFNIPE